MPPHYHFRSWLPSSWSTRMVGLLCLATAALLLGVAIGNSQTQSAGQQGRKITLKQQLTAGLKARTPADKAFIDKVVINVENGTLPRNLVDSTFLWAREKADAKSASRSLRPMVYFQPALLARAKMLGIKI